MGLAKTPISLMRKQIFTNNIQLNDFSFLCKENGEKKAVKKHT